MDRFTESEKTNSGSIITHPNNCGIITFSVCEKDIFWKIVKKLNEYEDLEEQCKLLKLPYAIGDEVFVITKCKYIPQQLDGTLYNSDGSFGDATGYYCPYEDNCPHYGDDFERCEKYESKNAIFQDTVSHIDIYETGITVFTENCNEPEFISAFCEDGDRHIFLTKEEAEDALQKMNEREGTEDENRK